MTRGLWWATWIFGGAAWAGLLAGWRDMLVVGALVSAAAWLAWGYRVHLDPDEWDEWQDEETAVKMSSRPNGGNPIYAAEREESRAALHSLTEWDWAASPHEYDGLGMTGDREDAHD